MLLHLVAVADFASGEAVFWVQDLRKELELESSVDTVTRELKKLRPEWIEFDLARGQRKPWVVRLTGAAVTDFRSTSANEGGDLRKSSSAVRKSEVAAVADVKPSFGSHDFRTAEVAPPVEEKRREEERSSDCELGTDATAPAEIDEAERAVDRDVFERALAPIVKRGTLHQRQREDAWSVWGNNRLELCVYVEDALKGKNPVALFADLVRRRPEQGSDRVRKHHRPGDPPADPARALRRLASSDGEDAGAARPFEIALTWDDCRTSLTDQAVRWRYEPSEAEWEAFRDAWHESYRARKERRAREEADETASALQPLERLRRVAMSQFALRSAPLDAGCWAHLEQTAEELGVTVDAAVREELQDLFDELHPEARIPAHDRDPPDDEFVIE